MSLYRPKSTYRVIAFLLIVALLICMLPRPQAKAIGGIDDATLGLVAAGVGVAVLGAYGIKLICDNQNTGTLSDFIGGKMQDYCDEYHDGADFGTVFGTGVTASAKGFLLTGAAILGLTKFAQWFCDREGLTSTDTVIDNTLSFNGISFGDTHYPIPVSSIPDLGKWGSLDLFGGAIHFEVSRGSQGHLSFYLTKFDGAEYKQNSSDKFPPDAVHDLTYTVTYDSGVAYIQFYSGSTLHAYSYAGLPVAPSSTTISGLYSPVSDYPVDGSSALAPESDFELEVISGTGGQAPDPDPELDALGNLAVNALQLYLAQDLVSNLNEVSDDPGGDPDDDPSSIQEVVTDIRTWVRTTFDDFIEAITDFTTTFWTNFTTNVRTIFDDMISGISDGWNTMTGFLSDFWDNLTSSISSAISSISDKLDDIKENMPDWDETFGDDVPTLPFGSNVTGFGSIWHYVVSWLGYISGFITLILSVWSSLPYAMVVPVYACVTLILVFGIYRKFIS